MDSQPVFFTLSGEVAKRLPGRRLVLKSFRHEFDSIWYESMIQLAEKWLSLQSRLTKLSKKYTGMQKQITNMITLLTLAALLTACSSGHDGKTEEPVYELSVAPLELKEIPFEGGKYEFTVSSTVDWTCSVEPASDWVKIGELIAQGIEVEILPNEGEERSARLVFKDVSGKASSVEVPVSQLAKPLPDPYEGYELKSSLNADASLLGADWHGVDSFMKKYKFEYTEHPNASDKDHVDGTHVEVVNDEALGMPVFKLSVHKSEAVTDGDRGSLVDRQRNEMKSRTSGSGYPEVNANYGEWQRLEWKFKIPKGYQPSNAFTHIHQLKAANGSDTGSPLITISLRSNSNGGNRRVQVIHTGRSGGESRGTFVDNVPMEDFEDEWVQVATEAHICRHGYYHILITRVSDGKVLIDKEMEDIDLWRAKGATSIRNKYGIYRNVGKDPFGSNTLLKDEHIYFADFKIYEKDTNEDPQPVDD